MKKRKIEAIVRDCEFQDYVFTVYEDEGRIHIGAHYYEADTLTGKMSLQTTRQWYISEPTNRSEVVATCFKCIMGSMEHKAREWFLYQNKAIYQPHHDVDKLLSITEER